MYPPNFNQFIPKYVRLRERFRQQILTGELVPHAPLPTEFELIRTDQVSRNTVIKAFNDLVAEKLIYRVQGKGTFVAEKTPAAVRSQAVGLVLQMDPHLFGPMARAVMEQLHRKSYHSLFVDAFQPQSESHWVIPTIQNLLAQNLDGVILDGDSMFPFHLLEKLRPECTITFIFRYESSHSLRANQVLSDDEQGGYLATRHLLDLGHRRILFVPTQSWNLKYNKCTATGIFAGARKALAEAGLPEAEIMIFERALSGVKSDEETTRENKAAFQNLLQKPNRPTAVFAFMDFIATEVYAGARAAGLDIPRDLSVIGYFNTPWCQMLEPALTSVSIQERELARLAVELTLKGISGNQHEPERILVPPEVILRNSTGSPANVDVTPLSEILPKCGSRRRKATI